MAGMIASKAGAISSARRISNVVTSRPSVRHPAVIVAVGGPIPTLAAKMPVVGLVGGGGGDISTRYVTALQRPSPSAISHLRQCDELFGPAEALAATLRPAILDRDGAALDPAKFAQPPDESGNKQAPGRRAPRYSLATLRPST
jgi:hypothetical protein